MQAAEKSDHLQLVAFRLAAEEYAVPIEMVESIIKLRPLTRVPGSPHCVLGVMNLRGRIMSVIDLRLRFGMPSEGDKPDGRILVARCSDTTIGLLVDTVSEVLSVDEMELQPPPPELGNGAIGAIDGIIHADNRLIVLLNVEAILRSTDGESMNEMVGVRS